MYEVKIFNGSSNNTVWFNQTFSIPYEGVFATYFLFGPHKNLEDDSEDFIGDLVDDIFGEDEPKKNGPNTNGRALTASHELDAKEPHLLIKGQISFANSFGFLNAD